MTISITPWAIVDDRPDSCAHARTLFALGNGRVGLRGCLEEDTDTANQAFVNGFYETWPIAYPEEAYGLAHVGQTIQPVPNPAHFTLRVNGETFDPHRAHVHDYARTLDLRTGQLSRHLVWETSDATLVTIDSTRLVSAMRPECARMEYSVQVNEPADVKLTHNLVLPHVCADNSEDPSMGDPADFDPRSSTALHDATRVVWRSHTGESGYTDPGDNPIGAVIRAVSSGVGVACLAAHRIAYRPTNSQVNPAQTNASPAHPMPDNGGAGTWSHDRAAIEDCGTSRCSEMPDVRRSPISTADGFNLRVSDLGTPSTISRQFTGRLEPGHTLTLEVMTSSTTDGPLTTDDSVPLSDASLIANARKALDSALTCPDLAAEQTQALTLWWETADIEAGVDPETQGAIRWNLFQAYQSAAQIAGAGIPAKGNTGSGYDGHTFWDADAMVLPTLVYTQPNLARDLLSYRFRTLERARQRAAELHHRGALFPWRTIDGHEASAFFEAGTAQYHIDADIAYSINRYISATKDMDYLTNQGLEILIETARLWASLGFFDEAGAFHIHGVTGPDEYSALVDDNSYTNVMAAANFDAALRWLDELRDQDEQAWHQLRERLSVSEDETALWSAASKAMTIVYNETLGIHAQDAHFLSHKVWDFEGTPPEMYPLLLHYHPLTIYRHQVLKQADLVLALINRPDLFSDEEMRADFDYYDRLTTGDSTLSACSQAIMAARVGHLDLAESYFRSSLLTDLGDTHGNTKDGVHIANAAAVWTTLVMGFAGFSDYNGFSLDPHLPPTWTHLTFPLRLNGSTLRITITPAEITLTHITGDPVNLTVCGHDVTVAPGTPVTVSLPH